MMALDCNLIAYEYDKGQYTIRPIYPSGERDETKLIDKYSGDKQELAVLVLEDDLINENGYGLKKGFYNVVPDKYMDFLLIYQAGSLKAKVPVVKMEVFETNNPKQQKVKRMSQLRYKLAQEKERRKYFKGENPAEVDYKTAKIHYIDEEKGEEREQTFHLWEDLTV